jgi:hypothetical protein
MMGWLVQTVADKGRNNSFSIHSRNLFSTHSILNPLHFTTLGSEWNRIESNRTNASSANRVLLFFNIQMRSNNRIESMDSTRWIRWSKSRYMDNPKAYSYYYIHTRAISESISAQLVSLVYYWRVRSIPKRPKHSVCEPNRAHGIIERWSPSARCLFLKVRLVSR